MSKKDKSKIDILLETAHTKSLEGVKDLKTPSFFLVKEEIMPIGSNDKLYNVMTYAEEETGVIYKVITENIEIGCDFNNGK